MSLKYDKNIVFWGCYLALVAHTLIAVILGISINKLLPISVLHFAATALYTFFAFLYLKDWHYADPDADIIEAGKAEVGEELEDDDDKAAAADTKNAEMGDVIGAQRDEIEEEPLKHAEGDPLDEVESNNRDAKAPVKRTKAPKTASKIFCECLWVMFIAEWGDRTQIAMIGQHASQPLIPVCVGSLLAFFLLTVSAVMVGMCMDGMKLSEKKVHLVSSMSFFVFAALALWDGLDSTK